jgi:hypothetical protein
VKESHNFRAWKKVHWAVLLSVGILALMSLGKTRAGAESQSDARTTVLVFNYSSAPRRALATAERASNVEDQQRRLRASHNSGVCNRS